MRDHLRPLTLSAAILLLTTGATAPVRRLSFEQRVQAQSAIERVYYSHQEGAKVPFERAVPRDTIERKVRASLRRSLALEKLWGAPITGAMLQAELRRIAAATRLPGRLEEIYAALGHDSFLIQETLARASLADRLARGRFASDPLIHARARGEAASLRERLIRGDVGDGSIGLHRDVIVLRRGGSSARPEAAPAARAGLDETVLDPDEFERARARAPRAAGSLSSVIEREDAYVIEQLLSEGPDEVRLARYRVARTSWDDWWARVSETLEADRLPAVADPGSALPLPSPALSGSCGPDDTWDNGSLDDIPPARSGHTAVWTGSLMIVWGGNGLDTGGRYDPVTDSWSPTSLAGAPAGRSGHTAVWTGTRMIVWGGGLQSVSFGDGSSYDPVADAWSPISGSGAPAPRAWHTAIWTGSEMIIWGGDATGTGGRYDPVSDTWSAVATTGAPAPRRVHTAVWTGSEMIVWGGLTPSSQLLGSGGRYAPATGVWTSLTDTDAPSPRFGHSAVWTGSEMIVWGGSAGTYLDTNDGARYDPGLDRWTPVSLDGAPDSRRYHTALWTGSRMLVWGGINLPCCDYSEPRETGGLYDPATDTWAPTSTLGAPSARDSHAAVWTGSEMIVWGGRFYNVTFSGPAVSYDNDGGRYAPATDTWIPTTASVPAGGPGHTTVWTGTLVIDWGGRDGTGFALTNAGGRYDPLLDAWSPTSTLDAPSPRAGQTAVWTGSRMLLWGGSSGDLLGSGGEYDPTADLWRALPPGGAPEPRTGHTAVWSGARMIVWGGQGASGRLATGGSYDPTSGLWSDVATLGAPAARSGHRAVWAGGRMIVWGGAVGSTTSTETGGRYDPATDLWSPTATAGAPSARRNHTAIWDGDRMIVWGGSTGSSSPTLGTGGLYDPVTDAWSPTSLTGAPSPRRDHAAVWTGRLMVVWGGGAATGGRYDPAADAWSPTSTLDAPSARSGHTAVWTGSHMVIWGGSGSQRSGGRYAVATPVDADADGFTTCGGDCDDGDPLVHPGAVDLPGNAVDEDCSGQASCDPGAAWRNRGTFMRCVARVCVDLVAAGSLTHAQCSDLVSEAARLPFVKRERVGRSGPPIEP